MLIFVSYSRGGASGNKLKMTLGLPVYVPSEIRSPCLPESYYTPAAVTMKPCKNQFHTGRI